MNKETTKMIDRFNNMSECDFRVFNDASLGQTLYILSNMGVKDEDRPIIDAFSQMTKRFFVWSKTNQCDCWSRKEIQLYEPKFNAMLQKITSRLKINEFL